MEIACQLKQGRSRDQVPVHEAAFEGPDATKIVTFPDEGRQFWLNAFLRTAPELFYLIVFNSF